jgi:hypothetical protein
MTERVYWNWFAMKTDEKKDLAVVVVECFNDQWKILECETVSDPMSMNEAEAKAMEKNLGAIKRGEHIVRLADQNRTSQDALTRELQELRIRVDALEQRIDKLEKNQQQGHDEG